MKTQRLTNVNLKRNSKKKVKSNFYKVKTSQFRGRKK